MLVERQQAHAQLDVEQAPDAEEDHWAVGAVEPARLPEAPVGLQLVRMLVRDLLEGLRADLLLALDQEAQRDRDLAEVLQHLESVDARHDVGLVVGDAASHEPAVLFHSLERVRLPLVDGVDRLHVVVLVQKELAAAGALHLCVQRGHPARVKSLDAVGETGETIGDPVAGRLDCIEAVVGDARKAAELFQLIDKAP